MAAISLICIDDTDPDFIAGDAKVHLDELLSADDVEVIHWSSADQVWTCRLGDFETEEEAIAAAVDEYLGAAVTTFSHFLKEVAA